MTAEGLAQIAAELERAQQAHAAAQIASDRGALARTARELRYWTSRRATAQLVPPPSDSAQVHFGSTVSILRDDGRRQTFRIVGEDEADPAQGTLSHVSPLARALFGKSVGDTIRAKLAGREPTELERDFPSVYDGARGVKFIEKVVESSKSSQKWTKF